MKIIINILLVFVFLSSCQFEKRTNNKKIISESLNNAVSKNDFENVQCPLLFDIKLLEELSANAENSDFNKVPESSLMKKFLLENGLGANAYYYCKLNSTFQVLLILDEYSTELILIRLENSKPIDYSTIASISGDGSDFNYILSKLSGDLIEAFYIKGYIEFSQPIDSVLVDEKGIIMISLKDTSKLIIDTVSTKRNYTTTMVNGEDISFFLENEKRF